MSAEILVLKKLVSQKNDELIRAYAAIDQILSHLAENGPDDVLQYIVDVLDDNDI